MRAPHHLLLMCSTILMYYGQNSEELELLNQTSAWEVEST